jgi:putative ABC transport system substrate-binding protein
MIRSKSGWLSGMVVAGAMLASVMTAAADPVRIGVANFGEHSQLNIAIEGFKKALTEAGYEEGKDVVYTVSHTNFDASLVPQMIAKLQAEQPKLIYTDTTPVSQIAQKAPAFRSSSPPSPIRSRPTSPRRGTKAAKASPALPIFRIWRP